MAQVTALEQDHPMIESAPGSSAKGPLQRDGRQTDRLRWVWIGFVAVGALVLISASSVYRDRCGPSSIAIFEGITYGCKRIDATEEGSGLLHWVLVDLV